MPDITVINETPSPLNIAFRFVAPAYWKNDLEPGESWTPPLASIPYTIEVRIDLSSNRFSAEDSWATAHGIVGGWLAGAASVVVGSVTGMGGGPTGGFSAAGGLMQHAVLAGAKFAKNAEGMVITVGGVWIPFHNKTYAIRFDNDTGFSLWDVQENRSL